MKKSLFIHPGLFVNCALIALFFISEKNLQASESALQVDITDFSASKIFVYDDQNEQWNLLRDIKYHFTDTGRVDSVEVYSPIVAGHRLDDEVISYKYDELGRTVKILIKEDGRNERGYEYSYFEDTELPMETKVLSFPDFVTPVTVEHTRWEYDGEGKLILYEEVKPIGSKKGDSIVYEYDDQDRTSLITHYRYEPISAQRIPWYLSTFNYTGENLEQINISFWNSLDQEWVDYQRIIDIQDPDVAETANGNLKGITIDNEEALPVYIKTKSFRVVDDRGNVVKEVRNTNNSDGSISKQIENHNLFPPTREESATLMPGFLEGIILEELNKIHLQEVFFGKEVAEAELTPYQTFQYEKYKKALMEAGGSDFIQEFASQVFIEDVEGFFESNVNTKSAAVQRVLTLTSQVAIGESVDWQNRFKQEFFYEGNATNVNNNQLENRIRIFPNPSNGKINIELESTGSKIRFEVINIMGSIVHTESITENTSGSVHSLDLGYLQNGTYIIRASTDRDVMNVKINLER